MGVITSVVRCTVEPIMARRPPLRHFTILLLKPEIETFSDALKADQDLVELDVPSVSGTLVAKPRQVKKPWWIAFIGPHVSGQKRLRIS